MLWTCGSLHRYTRPRPSLVSRSAPYCWHMGPIPHSSTVILKVHQTPPPLGKSMREFNVSYFMYYCLISTSFFTLFHLHTTVKHVVNGVKALVILTYLLLQQYLTELMLLLKVLPQTLTKNPQRMNTQVICIQGSLLKS